MFGMLPEKMAPKDEPEKIFDKTEKEKVAEKSLRERFDEKLAEVLDRIGKNPVYQNFSDRAEF